MEETNLERTKRRMYAELFGEKEERVITHRDVELMRERIGIEVPLTQPYNEECTKDGLRKLASGDGNLNPLYWNDDYAMQTRWGGAVASPTFIHSTGTSVKRELAPDEKARGAGALSGIQLWDGGEDCYYYRPIRLEDFIWSKRYLTDMAVKKSQFAGTIVITRARQFWANDKGELLAASTKTSIWGGRERIPGERAKYAHIKGKHRYTPEDIVRIDADLDKEEIRGSNPRYWEDVNEGDELTPVVKGPVLYVDLFNFNIGHGLSTYSGSHRWTYEHRKRHPAAWVVNRFGIPDTIEGVQFVQDGFAKWVGLPAEYVYGDLLYAWIAHLITNWMGDDAWLYHMEGRWQEFVFLYDANCVKGKIARKYIDPAGQYKVDIDIHSEDQRGRVPITGSATVILPSKVCGLPKAPPSDTPAPFDPEEARVPVGERP